MLSVAVAGAMDLESGAMEEGSSRTSCSLESRLALRLRRELSGLQRRRRSLMISTALAGWGRGWFSMLWLSWVFTYYASIKSPASSVDCSRMYVDVEMQVLK